MYELNIKTNFSAAHFLRHYQGKCKRLHGHNWLVDITVSTEKLDKTGLGIDFCVLKKEAEKVIMGLDHKNLNEIAFFKNRNPSSENIARFIYKKLSKDMSRYNIKISKIKVAETENNSVTYWE